MFALRVVDTSLSGKIIRTGFGLVLVLQFLWYKTARTSTEINHFFFFKVSLNMSSHCLNVFTGAILLDLELNILQTKY